MNTLYQIHGLACISSLEASNGEQSPIFSYSFGISIAQNPVALWSSLSNLLELIFRVNDTTCSKCLSVLTDHGPGSFSALTIANLGGICRHFWDSSQLHFHLFWVVGWIGPSFKWVMLHLYLVEMPQLFLQVEANFSDLQEPKQICCNFYVLIIVNAINKCLLCTSNFAKHVTNFHVYRLFG